MTSSPAARITRTAVGSGAVLSLGAAMVGPVPSAGALTYTVTNEQPNGAGSLRQAIMDANAHAGDDTITFAPGVDLIELGYAPAVLDGVTIVGPGQAALTIRGGIDLVTGNELVTISGVTLEHGNGLGNGLMVGGDTTIRDSTLSGDLVGPAVRGSGAELTLERTTVRDGRGEPFYGGGISFYDGTVTVVDSLITGNGGLRRGGGIRARNTDLTVVDSEVTGNTAGLGLYGYGGGILVDGSGTLTLTGSTISGNTAARLGGGIALRGGPTVDIENSTISGNIGNGVHVFDGIGTISHSTIASNDGGYSPGEFRSAAGLNLSDAGVVVDHTLVADNVTDGDPADIGGGGGSILFLSNSLIESEPAPDLFVQDDGGNLVGVDPGLLPLGDNGGPTETHALGPGSAARDAGDSGFAPPPATDQRGEIRVSGPVIDIGAFEEEQTPIVLPGGSAVDEGNTGTRVVNVKVRLSWRSLDPVTVDWATLDSVAQPAEGVDYVAASGTVTFPPGQIVRTVPVTIIGDTTDEPVEWVPVQFSNPTNAIVGGFGGIGFGQIRDDDPQPTVLPGGGAVTEGNAGTTVVNVKVKLSNPSSMPVTVDWATDDSVGQPAEGVDYVSASGQVTFAPGEVLKIVPITILGDLSDEPDEWVPVQFSNATNATLGGFGGLGFGLIRDDD